MTAAALATGPHARLAALVERARQRVAGGELPRVALVWPCDALAHEAASAMAAAGIATPVLVGPAARIGATPFEVVNTPDMPAEAARVAVAMAREGRVAALMKGSLHTDELMSAIVARETGLRGTRRISHAFLFDLPRYPKLLALADCVVNIAPNLATKHDVLANALDLLRRLGIAQPKAAIVAAVETVNPAIPATLDAQALVQRAIQEQGQGAFGNALVEGPFGFDIAYSAAAARIKGLKSLVAGDADLMLMPDLNAGNMLYKSFVYAAGGDCAGLVLGTRVPVVLTSRADSLQARMASVALAVLTTP